MEGKIGVIATQVEAVGKRGRHRLTKRRYVATFGPAEEVGRLSYAAARELGATEVLSELRSQKSFSDAWNAHLLTH
jgi:hypothetical protein